MKVKIDKSRKVYKGNLYSGRINENKYEVLELEFPQELEDFTKYIEIEATDNEGTLRYADRIEDNEFAIDNTLSKYSLITAQVVCKDLRENVVFKSNPFEFTFEQSLNIMEDIEEEQQDLLDRIELELQEAKEDITDLQETEAQHTEQIQTNATDIEDLQGRVTTNETDIANIKTKNTQQDTAIGTNTQDISNIKAEQTTQNTNITSNTNRITVLEAQSGNKVALSINSNYVMTLQLLNKANEVLSTGTIDLPIESMIVNASYRNGILTLTLQNGQTLDVDISDIVSGLVSETTFNTVIDELNEKIENIVPKNISNLFNDGFFALPFRQGSEINKNNSLRTTYTDNIKRLDLDTSNVTEGTGADCWVNGIINSNFAPIVIDGKLSFPVDIVVNISSDNVDDTFAIFLNSRGDWANGANYYFYKTNLKQGINIIRLGTGTKVNIPDNTMLNYVVVRSNNGNNFKTSISAFRQNDALYRLENKLIEPSMLSKNLNDDFQAIPFSQFYLINKGKTAGFTCDNTKISANTHDIEAGTGSASYIRFMFDNKFIPEAINEKFEKPLDVFLNIESDNENQTYRVILSSGRDWKPANSLKSITIKGNGLHHVRFDGTGFNHYNKTTYPSILITNSNGNYNIKVSITAYYENNILSDVYNKFDTVNDEIGEINRKIASDKEIVCWGDSLTAGGGWTTRLQELSGITVYNGGTGGENAKTIMARQGGDVMLINNITIPADTTPVLIASRSTDVGISTYFGNKATPLLQGGSHVNPVKIGDIEGTLRWTGSAYNDQTGTWTFTRSEAGDEVTIDRPTAMTTNFDRIHNSPYLMIIFMGQNGGYDSVEDLINKHKLMIEHAKAENVIVLGLSSGSASGRESYETAMRNEFGRYFISLREYLAHPIYDENQNIVSCYGLADQNLTPTEDDLAKIATGTVPASCLADSVHYTSGTKTVIGNMIYKKCCELGIF